MPYKDKDKDREWHRVKMWVKRHDVTPIVTPDVTPKTVKIDGKTYEVPELDADGNVMPGCD